VSVWRKNERVGDEKDRRDTETGNCSCIYPIFLLRMSQRPLVSELEKRIRVKFSRSPGPGGQNVNKVSTKVDLRLGPREDVERILPEELWRRMGELNPSKKTKSGDFVVTSSRYRTQRENLKDAKEKLQRIIDEANELPEERKKTVAPEWVARERVKKKRAKGETKRMRRVKAEEW